MIKMLRRKDKLQPNKEKRSKKRKKKRVDRLQGHSLALLVALSLLMWASHKADYLA